jgi:pyruvate dehydrogenase E2 component (dihydrolipoamide acetyltransferase)
MPTIFPMPKLGLDMTSGVIVHWLVKEGERVAQDQPIVEIETDKAAQELLAPANGIVGHILKTEGADVPCGEPIAIILADGESLSDVNMAMLILAPAESAKATAPVAAGPSTGTGERIFISPVAKRRARELGVDLDTVTLQNGKIGLDEIEAAFARKQAGGLASTPVPVKQEMSTTRRKIAEHMSRSARTVARVGLTLEVDATNLIAWREKLSAGEKKISYNVLLVSLAARALREFPYMNSQINGESIVTMPEVNISVAVDTAKGLVAPILHQSDKKDVAALQAEFEELSERALSGKSRVEDLQGGTFTITNLGSLDIETFLPVINVPECAILGVGAIIKKPVVVKDQVVIRSRMGLTLAFDHRLTDGAPAARFLQRFKQLVETAGN